MKKAILNKDLSKDGWYDYKKGTEFKVLNEKSTLTLVEDWLGFQYWLKNEDLDISNEN